MLVWEVARKYANALFLSVRQKNLVSEADEQFLALKKLVTSDRTLLDFLTAPQVSEEKKETLIQEVFGPRMERLLVEFLLVLVHKHRINFLPEIVEEFDRLVKVENGISKVTAITAVPMSDAEVTALVDRLTAKTGMKIELKKKVEPSILGGMILLMHNQIVDGSVRHGLDVLEDQLARVKVH